MPTEVSSSAWPPFLAPMRELLEKVHPPDGPFDANGGWEHSYTVCALVPERGAKGEHPRSYGQLVLTRKPAGAGELSLAVDFSTTRPNGAGSHIHALLACAADRIATPRKWELQSESVVKGAVTPLTSVSETAALKGGTLVRRGRVERKTATPGAITSNWSLMEAVQRLPFADFPPISFEMLEDLDLRKPGQTLGPAGNVSLELAGKQVRLHAFRQLGHGILPIHYWVNDQHRLLAVTGGLRGFVWATGAAKPGKQGA